MVLRGVMQLSMPIIMTRAKFLHRCLRAPIKLIQMEFFVVMPAVGHFAKDCTEKRLTRLYHFLMFDTFSSPPEVAWAPGAVQDWFSSIGPAHEPPVVSSFRELCLGYFPNFQPRLALASSASPPSGSTPPLQCSNATSVPSRSSLLVQSRVSATMANIPIDPCPFVPHGFKIQHIEGHNGVARVVLPHRQQSHVDWAIATIHPLPAEAHFPNVRDVLEEFVIVHKRLVFMIFSVVCLVRHMFL